MYNIFFLFRDFDRPFFAPATTLEIDRLGIY